MSDPLMSFGRPALTAADLALVEDIFADASEAAPSTWPELIASRSGERTDIRLEVEALLAAHARAASFMGSAEESTSRAESQTAATTIIGHYRLVEKIGEGGMGDVYLGERADGLFEHRVAVKVIRASLQDAELARRFAAERQILASLQHANIVTLLDGGATADGQAYLVMEHVDGLPVTSYCRERGLSLDGRLTLLVRVCRAVQYAHQRAIVHRDLKPANILVTSDGVPKVLDFGIAKLLEASVPGAATVTSLFPGPMTPNYASPEQLRGLPVTTACDVYALGVLVYEVVTGVRPYDTSGRPLDQVLEIVLHTEAVRPSAAKGDTTLAEGWRSRAKGDLDAIVLKAIAKEPERRYGSAGELADDLERYLAGKPVVAREPSAAYMLRRLAARNTTAVAIAAASLVLILGALGTALWQRQVAVRAQGRAEARFKEVRQLANTLIFKIHDAVAPLPGSTPVRQTIVNEALAYLERLEAESRDDESLRLELSGAYRQVGAILGDPQAPNLGNRPAALAQFERARNLVLPLASRANAAPGAIEALVSVDRLLSSLLTIQDQQARATEFAHESVNYAERKLREAPQDRAARDLLAKAAFNMAYTVRGEQSIPYWRRAGELFEAQLAEKPDDPQQQRNVALVEKYLGAVLDENIGDAEALPHFGRALELDEKCSARDPTNRQAQFDVAIDLGNVALLAERAKRFDDAYAMLSRSLEIRQKLWASDPQDARAKSRVGYVQMRLAAIDTQRGRTVSALAHAREAVRIQETVAGATKDLPVRHELAEGLMALAGAETAAGMRPAACASARRALLIFQVMPPSIRNQTKSDEEAITHVAACDGAGLAGGAGRGR